MSDVLRVLISPSSSFLSSSTAKFRWGMPRTSAKNSSERIEMSGFLSPAAAKRSIGQPVSCRRPSGGSSPPSVDPDVIVGSDTDDAAVYRISKELAIVETVDFFTPVVDDPYLFGAISAANSLSDIYAMGARPGDALVLTKPVGVGIISTAVKSGLADDAVAREAGELMATLNRAASEVMLDVGAHASATGPSRWSERCREEEQSCEGERAGSEGSQSHSLTDIMLLSYLFVLRRVNPAPACSSDNLRAVTQYPLHGEQVSQGRRNGIRETCGLLSQIGLLRLVQARLQVLELALEVERKCLIDLAHIGGDDLQSGVPEELVCTGPHESCDHHIAVGEKSVHQPVSTLGIRSEAVLPFVAGLWMRLLSGEALVARLLAYLHLGDLPVLHGEHGDVRARAEVGTDADLVLSRHCYLHSCLLWPRGQQLDQLHRRENGARPR